MTEFLKHNIVCIANEKGGTGKSTIAANTAVKSTLLGFKTLLVDSDSHQMSGTYFSVLRNKNDSLKHLQVIQNSKTTIYKDLSVFADDYDLIVIDSPGRASDVFYSTVMCSDLCVIPTKSGSQEFLSTRKTIQYIHNVSDQIKRNIEIFVFFNLIKNKKSTLHFDYHLDLKKLCENDPSVTVSDSFLVDRNVFSTSFANGESVYESKKKDIFAISEFDIIFNQIFFGGVSNDRK